MHGHLKEAVEDYGPVFGFWLFSFERYNGTLDNQSTNLKDIESQLLSRFVRDNFAYSYEFPSDIHDEFKEMCSADIRYCMQYFLCASEVFEQPLCALRDKVRE